MYGEEHGISANFDTSWSKGLFTASINLKLNHYPESGATEFGPQAEFTYWFFANMGGGGGYLFGDRAGPILHLFVGFPLGDDFSKQGLLGRIISPFRSFYIEPYARANFFFPDGLKFFVEVGVMIKITTFQI